MAACFTLLVQGLLTQDPQSVTTWLLMQKLHQKPPSLSSNQDGSGLDGRPRFFDGCAVEFDGLEAEL